MVPAQPESRELPPGDSIARHCRPRTILPNGRPARAAFMLRPGEAYLSANWLEYFHDSNRPAQIAGVRRALTAKGFQLRRAARFAVLNVGDAVATCRAGCPDANIRIVALGETRDPSHAGIYGVAPPNNIAIAALLAAAVAPDDVYPAII